MKKKKLGNTSLETMPVIFGGNVLGWTINEKESFDILDQFFEAGFNTIDTADVYSKWVPGNQGGESETIIGKWMKARKNRDKLNIITKVGSDIFGKGHIDISEKHILKAVEGSLKRLQIDAIDLYLTHFDDDKTPVTETLGAYQKLIEAGKVRYIGASNLSAERLSASLEASGMYSLPRYEVFQSGYNLFDRQDFEKSIAKVCEENNLGVITYFSLAKGFLTGKYRSEADLSQSVRGGGVKNYLNERGFRILDALDELSSKYKVSQAAVALAWLLHKPVVSAPIASATKRIHLQAFTEAAQLELKADDLLYLEDVSK